jgi:hypothetical protein
MMKIELGVVPTWESRTLVISGENWHTKKHI